VAVYCVDLIVEQLAEDDGVLRIPGSGELVEPREVVTIGGDPLLRIAPATYVGRLLGARSPGWQSSPGRWCKSLARTAASYIA
jgi:hypothetical protein